MFLWQQHIVITNPYRFGTNWWRLRQYHSSSLNIFIEKYIVSPKGLTFCIWLFAVKNVFFFIDVLRMTKEIPLFILQIILQIILKTILKIILQIVSYNQHLSVHYQYPENSLWKYSDEFDLKKCYVNNTCLVMSTLINYMFLDLCYFFRCHHGWQGSSCSLCIPHKNCLHGTCDGQPWTCECEKDWGGLMCDQGNVSCGS